MPEHSEKHGRAPTTSRSAADRAAAVGHGIAQLSPIQFLRTGRRLRDGALVIELDSEDLGVYIHQGRVLRRYRIENVLMVYVDPATNEILSASFAPLDPGDFGEALVQLTGGGDDGPDPPDEGRVARGHHGARLFRVTGLCLCELVGEEAHITFDHAVERAPVVAILRPRARAGIDNAIVAALEALKRAQGSGVFSALLSGAITNLTELKNRLVSMYADVPVDFPQLRLKILDVLRRVDAAREQKRIDDETHGLLRSRVQQVLNEFDRYAQPKRELHLPHRLTRQVLLRLGVRGLNLGGIGEHVGFLDVNVGDDTNDPGLLIVGDARDLARQFAENCVDEVHAVLLPLVLMVEGEDTRESRRLAVIRVLRSVNHVTGGAGRVSVEFNDNSGEQALTAEDLRRLAEEFGFSVELQINGRKFKFTR